MAIGGIWKTDTIEAEFAGGLIYCRRASSSREYDIVTHKALGSIGGLLEAMGGSPRELPLTCVFAEGYFQAHKAFLAALDLCVQSGVAGTLSHPVYGVLQVFPTKKWEVQIDAESHVAIVEATFAIASPLPDVIAAGAYTLPNTFQADSVPANLADYLSTLALLTATQSAFIDALVTLIGEAGSAPAMIYDSAQAWGAAFANFVQGQADQYAASFATYSTNSGKQYGMTNSGTQYSIVSPELAAALQRVFAQADRVEQAFLAATPKNWETQYSIMSPNLSTIADIKAGTDSYDAGNLLTGEPGNLGTQYGIVSPNPPASFHAALVAVAVWEATVAGALLNQLIALMQDASRSRTLDLGDAEDAIVYARRRAAQAMRLVDRAMGAFGAPICRQLSVVAAGLPNLLNLCRDLAQRPTPREWTVDYTMPLAAIAQRLLGDGGRADDIRNLNPAFLGDFNRIPPGTLLLVPVS